MNLQPVRQKEAKPARDKAYRMWIASLPCVVCRRIDVQCAHVKNGWKRMGQKNSDFQTVPLCVDCHREQHDFGNEMRWWQEVRIDPMKVIAELRRVYPDAMAAWTMIQNVKRICKAT